MSRRVEYQVDLGGGEAASHLEFRLDERRVLSGGALIECMLACVRHETSVSAMHEAQFCSPVACPYGTVAVLALDRDSKRYELRSRAYDGTSPSGWRLHAFSSAGNSDEARAIRVRAPGQRPEAILDAGDFYRALAAVGVAYDPPLRLMERVEVVEGGALARAHLAQQDLGSSSAFLLHPGLADAALQLVCLLATRDRPRANRLAYIGSVSVRTEVRPGLFMLSVVRGEPHPDCIGWDVQILASDGELIARLEDIRFETSDEQHERHIAVHAGQVAEIARSQLGVDQLGVHQNLVAAGATSLDLVRILGILADDWGWSPALEDVLGKPTPWSVARLYAEDENSARSQPRGLVSERMAHSEESATELSYAERRLWYLERFADATPAYNEAAAWLIEGDLDLDLLARSLDAIVARHEVLRTSFPELDGEPYRKVAHQTKLPLREVDVSGSAPGQRIDELLANEVRQPFLIESGSLIRATLFRMTPVRSAFILVAHHIVCDGWSIAEVLREEIGLFYTSFKLRREPVQLPPAVGMSQQAQRERKRIAGDHLRNLLSWWAGELDGTPTLFRLASDYARPVRDAHHGARVAFNIEGELAAALRSFSRSAATTRFVVLLAAYQALLFRYGQQEKFVIAVPVSLRHGPSEERIVGCLINTLPIRVSIDGNCTLADLVTSAASIVARALSKKEAPFDQLVTCLRCERSLGHAPLTQVAFAYYEAQSEAIDLDGLDTRRIDVDSKASKFDLALELRDVNGEIRGTFQYNTELFESTRILQMKRHFCRIVAQLATDASVYVTGDWLLDVGDRQALEAFGTGISVPLERSDVRGVVDAQLEGAADRTALAFGDNRRTYGELALDVARLSAVVAGRIGAEDRVLGLCVGRSSQWVAGVLATLRLGRGYLPIDPQVPAKRALHLLKDCAIRWLLYSADECSWAEEFGANAIELSEAMREGAALRVPRADFAPDATIYAIATSGSTGVPKTAAVSYRAFANLIEWYAKALRVSAEDRVVVVTSVAFDLTQKNLFVTLGAGAKLVLWKDVGFDPQDLAALIEHEEISIVNCTPSIFNALLDGCADRDYVELSSLRCVVLGGEAIDLPRIERWRASMNCHATIMNSYGPTECTDVCAAYWLEGNGHAHSGVPIGRPIQNVNLKVLDERSGLVPIGVVGELCISGVALGQGYLGSEASRLATATKIEGRQRFYRTGDLVRYLWNGNLVFVGRADEQTKIRGHRVGLLEVELALREHPAVLAAAVTVLGSTTESRSLCAHYVAGPEVTPRELRRWLANFLPQYMVPSSFIRVPKLPLAQNGKIDQKALSAPWVETNRKSVVEPRTELEKELCDLWKHVLGRLDFGIDDDFFDLGGHSLLAVRLVQEIQRQISIHCRVADVVGNPTVEGLADLLRSRERVKPAMDAEG